MARSARPGQQYGLGTEHAACGSAAAPLTRPPAAAKTDATQTRRDQSPHGRRGSHLGSTRIRARAAQLAACAQASVRSVGAATLGRAGAFEKKKLTTAHPPCPRAHRLILIPPRRTPSAMRAIHAATAATDAGDLAMLTRALAAVSPVGLQGGAATMSHCGADERGRRDCLDQSWLCLM